MAACGLDFGTSNSALGVIREGAPTLAAVEGEETLIPTTVFLDLDNWAHPRFGSAAIGAAIAMENGRFMRALKTILGTALIEKTTMIGPHRIKLTGVVERFIRHMKTKGEGFLGQELTQVVHGRPVHFADGDDAADKRAEATLEKIARDAGFREVRFVYEPIAAAYHYEETATREELVLIADIGGGTSDFSVIRIGPERRGRMERGDDVLANRGVRIGGTDLDTLLNVQTVMPLLGLGSDLISKNLPMPKGIYYELATWALINFAYTFANERMVRELLADAKAPERVARLQRVLQQRLGHRIGFSVEAAKIALSAVPAAPVPLQFIEDGLAALASREGFDTAIGEKTAALTRIAKECIAAAGLKGEQIDTVFFTGGSSRVPAIQKAIAAAAPGAKPSSGSDLLSVALGLTREAAKVFG